MRLRLLQHDLNDQVLIYSNEMDMLSPEITILGLNLAVMLMAYVVIYPTFCGSDGNKIAVNDLIASVVVLVAAGAIYFATGQRFTMLFFETNWFWFTLLSYALIEIPLMFWYFKKHDVWSSLKDEESP